jgi:hypothetical protein
MKAEHEKEVREFNKDQYTTTTKRVDRLFGDEKVETEITTIIYSGKDN